MKDPDRLVATIEASFPYPDQMDRFYGFNVQLFQIALPNHMAIELVSASAQEAIIDTRQKAAQEAGQKIRNDVESFVADCVASLREQTAQLCQDVLGSINGCETGVHQGRTRLLAYLSGSLGEDSRLASAPAEVEAAAAQEHNCQHDDEYS